MIITQQAFVNGGKNMLKGALHCHTTRSDSKTTPEDTIRQHAEAGYDFMALTDHRFYNYKNFAPETNMLIMPGMELDYNITTDDGMCFHIVCIGGDEETNGYKQDDRFETKRVKNAVECRKYAKEIIANGNLAIYCHPEWSCTPARSFEALLGECFAMEIWNTGCVLSDELDVDNGFIWDELLMRGERVFAVATDDGHNANQHCKGWVRVNAEKNRASIFNALKNGAFYASCGPEIYSFSVEDGVAHLECSPCEYIHFYCGARPMRLIKNDGKPIESTDERLPANIPYLRAVVMDTQGRKAWTNPIFLND